VVGKVSGVWEESIKLPREGGLGSGGEASDLLTGIGVMDVAVGGFGEGDEGEIGAVE